ncbi:MAG: deoxyribose-phosphate aldolase [Vicingaceae bacterium]
MSKKTVKTKDFSKTPTVDQVGVLDRIGRITARSIKKESKIEGLKMALSMIDLTTLEGADTHKKVEQLCNKAMHLHQGLDVPTVAAVCVYPNYVKTAKQALKGTDIKVASVATAFPSGNSSLEIKIADTKLALDNGADEVDMVISRGKFHEGDYNYVFDEIATIKDLCKKQARLKVILETGELGSLDKVRKASDIAIYAGADFIKTSTGKIKPAATLPVTCVMLEAIKDYFYATGKMVGMKPAGGISNAKTALQYLMLVKETLGNDWLNNKWFRFGASSLANDVLMQIVKQQTGIYQSKDYFSKD